MLLGNFFFIDKIEQVVDNPEAVPGSSHLLATVSLNGDHPIFSGHFPGNPVVPGVCQVQMIREVIENFVTRNGMLCDADNIKFLSAIVPGEHAALTLDIRIKPIAGEKLDITASIGVPGTLFLKFRGTLCLQPS